MIVSAEQILANIAAEDQARGRRPPTPRRVTNPNAVTDEETDLLTRLAEGWGNSAIPAEAGLTIDGIKSELRVLFKKMGATNRAHAVHLAHQRGLVK